MKFDRVDHELLLFGLNFVDEAIILFDNYRITFVNDSFQTFSGYNNDQLIGKSKDFPFLFPEEQQIFVDHLLNCSDQETSVCFLLKWNKRTMPLDFPFKFKRMNSGKVGVFVSQNDRTIRINKRFKWLELADSYSKSIWCVAELLDDLQDFHRVAMGKGAFDTALQQGQLATQAKDGSISFKTGGLNEEEVRRAYHEASKVNEENYHHEFEDVLTLPNGNLHFLHHFYYIGKSENGNTLVLNWIENLTTQRLIELELENKRKQVIEMQERVRFLEAIYNNSPLVMGVLELTDNDTDRTFVLANPAFLKKMGKTADEVIGKKASALGYDPQWLKETGAVYRNAKNTGTPVVYDMKTPFGDDVYYLVNTIHLYDDKFAIICSDCSTQKKLEKELIKHKEQLEELVNQRTIELQRALEVKSRFLATMSHEIRTPLYGITSALQLLEDSSPTRDQQAILQIAKVCGEQLLVVINDVLDLSRLEENRTVLEMRSFSPRAMLEDCVEVIVIEIEKKNLEIICNIDSSVPNYVVGDCSRVRQIILNLLSNAIKFSNKGEIRLDARAIDVESDSDKDYCELSVSVKDEGIGIPESSQKYIFQPFTQADSSFTRRYGGSGLGLSISKKLCELMHGDLWFTSEESKGSVFTFRVRLEKCKSVPSNSNIQQLLYQIRDRKVLIVDPHLSRRNATSKVLRSVNMVPIEFSSGEEALNYLNNHPDHNIEIALMDNTESPNIFQSIRKHVTHVVQTGYTPGYVDYPFWKIPVRETTLADQMVKLLGPIQERKTEDTKNIHKVERILMAEDNIMNQKVLHRLLRNLGYQQVDIVENGKQAVKAVSEKKYDIVLMDCMMPEMTGIEATEIIRTQLPKEKQPGCILALTANVFSENKERCLSVGMDGVLTKPIATSQLRDTLLQYSSN